ASRGARLAARMLDHMLDLVALAPGLVALYRLYTETRADPGVAFTFTLLFGPITTLQGYQWYSVVTRGQSIAKRWLGVRIVAMDGSAVGFVNGVILRSWVPWCLGLVPWVGFLFAVADGLAIFGDD